MVLKRSFSTVCVLLFCPTLVAAGTPTTPLLIDWQCWQNLPVQNGGRHKPLDTVAWETLRITSNRASVVDTETGRTLSPTALYLTLIFEWSGWDHERSESLLVSNELGSQYSYFHQTDRWDKTALLRVDFPALMRMLGIPDHEKYVAPATLATASITDPRTNERVPFPTWGRVLLELKQAEKQLTPLEEKGLELADRLHVYQSQRMGLGIEILPVPGDRGAEWLSVADLLLRTFDETSDPRGGFRRAQKLLWDTRTAYRSGKTNEFNRLSEDFCTMLRTLGATSTSYPSDFKIRLEVAYNYWTPFRYAWIAMQLATISMLLHLGSRWRLLYWGSVICYGLGMIALTIGFLMRVLISGRAPVTNMYESVIYVGAGVAAIGVIFEAIYRKRYILTAAAAVSAITLILADNCPAVLDPSIRPLEPVLRSNFWLVTHVMTIALSYAAFALALGIANISLGYYLVRSNDIVTIRALSQFTYRAIQVGVLLLAAGIILGGVWADYSWGRFWGWDPKEVWALVALLGYLAVLHARYGGAVGHRGLAVFTVICFSLVVMAWYGVNFVLGAGLHSYGFGGGGQGFVYLAVVAQWLYAGIALRRSRDPTFAGSISQERDWLSSHAAADAPLIRAARS
jgi:cytochrome c-type biogenesis protein CcsB